MSATPTPPPPTVYDMSPAGLHYVHCMTADYAGEPSAVDFLMRSMDRILQFAKRIVAFDPDEGIAVWEDGTRWRTDGWVPYVPETTLEGFPAAMWYCLGKARWVCTLAWRPDENTPEGREYDLL